MTEEGINVAGEPGPFGSAANQYVAAGWLGVLPLAGKKNILKSLTGGEGMDAGSDRQYLNELLYHYGDFNIGIRMPEGVVGLDVDDYGEKHGAETLTQLAERAGPLPVTWTSTARGAGASRTHFFRFRHDGPLRWRNQPGIDIIQRGHRYSAVWPSINPDTDTMYRWWNPDGEMIDEIPHQIDLAELPQSWIEALTERPLTVAETGEWLLGLRADTTCEVVREVAYHAYEDLGNEQLSRHETMRNSQLQLCGLAAEGHAGVTPALHTLFQRFISVKPGGEAEWQRALEGAAARMRPRTPPAMCTCEVQRRLYADSDALGEFLQTVAPRQRQPETQPEFNLKDFTASQLQLLPRSKPLVDGLLYRGTMAWLVAPPGKYKSFVALDIAAHVALGVDWMGQHVPESLPVFYMMLEGVSGLRDRLPAWEHGHERPYPEAVHFRGESLIVKDDNQWAEALLILSRLRPGLVIIDTQSRSALGYEENSNSEMSQYIEKISMLRRLDITDNACILVVHHSAKHSRTMRGAGAIHGAEDTELWLDPNEFDDTAITLTIEKQKDGPQDLRIPLKMVRVEFTDPEDKQIHNSLYVTKPVQQMDAPDAPKRFVENFHKQWILHAARQISHGQPVSFEQVMRRVIALGWGMEATTADEAWNSLISDGLLMRSGTVKVVPSDPPELNLGETNNPYTDVQGKDLQ